LKVAPIVGARIVASTLKNSTFPFSRSISFRKLPYEFVVLNDSVPNAWGLPVNLTGLL
jgi:hypothetical protein